ncbi:MAG: low specificity L-threonine aldolase [Chloroflexi bacterium]|nr:low specificity L-threonine aldolase [Chloroflexota bacterium]
MQIEVDLFSDTVTRPSAAMRRFMCDAEVGDEQKGEDPTTNLLNEMVAELLGKEAAVFLPSGTMCNEIAIRVHCRSGDEMIAHHSAHPIHYEGGGPAALAGVNVRSLEGPRGMFDAPTAAAAIRPPSRHFPRSRLLWVEQTSNLGGGAIWPVERIGEVTAVARDSGLATHLDGARLMNAVVASGVAAATYSGPFDSAWIDFSKGLGAPVGASLAGSKDFIAEAWRFKQQMGGAMRQSGIIAAGAVYALRHNVERLAEDHANAKRLAAGLAELPGLAVDPATVETNIVLVELSGKLDAATAVDRLQAQGVRFSLMGPRTLRAVTHLDVSVDGIDKALAAARRVFK